MTELPKKRYSAEFLKFYEFACKKAEKHGKIIDIRDSKFVLFEGKCQGYCDGDQVVVAGRIKNFESVFVHEVSHLEQSIENSPHWLSADHWPKKFKIEDFEDYFKIIQMERDCEIRSVKHGKRWGLFDINNYIKRANSYLIFYHFAFLRKKWVYFKNLYCKEILDEMPSKIFSEESLKKIDMDLMRLYAKVYDEKNR